MFPSSLNHKFITLISKKKNPELVLDFRQISLCNVLYKIVAKNLANCLKMILPRVISSTHSAFVLAHLISDNILIAYEMMHHLSKKRNGKFELMSLKLDM